eukprot:s1716_g2.t1
MPSGCQWGAPLHFQAVSRSSLGVGRWALVGIATGFSTAATAQVAANANPFAVRQFPDPRLPLAAIRGSYFGLGPRSFCLGPLVAWLKQLRFPLARVFFGWLGQSLGSGSQTDVKDLSAKGHLVEFLVIESHSVPPKGSATLVHAVLSASKISAREEPRPKWPWYW